MKNFDIQGNSGGNFPTPKFPLVKEGAEADKS